MNGYSKLLLAGKERGFKFDIKAIGAILKRLGVGIEGLNGVMTSNPFEAYPAIVYEGLKRNAERKEEAIPEFDEVMDWVEQDGILTENVLNIVKVFGDSLVSMIPQSAKETGSPNVKKPAKK